MMSTGMQHVNRHASEPTNSCVCNSTAGNTLPSILQHLFQVRHHLILTSIFPPVHPLSDLINIAFMRRACIVVLIMQSEVVIWCL